MALAIQSIEFTNISIPTKKGGTQATVTVNVTPVGFDCSYPITIHVQKRFFAQDGDYKNKKRYNIEERILAAWNKFCKEHQIVLRDLFQIDGAL